MLDITARVTLEGHMMSQVLCCMPVRRLIAARAWLIGLLAALGLAGPALATGSCPPMPAFANLHLPHLRHTIATGGEAIIVALGSSSTEGVAASDIAHSYPAMLQAALSAAWPASHVAVINRGIGGQDAPEELSRLESDVIAIRPQLVIWQVGANGAMRNADPTEFSRLVTQGVRRLKAAGIDVILMDNQRAPRITAAADHVALEASLAEVAEETGVNLFSRGVLMDGWRREGLPQAQFIAADGLHHNDLGYRCVAQALAARIDAATRMPASVTASR